MSSLSSPTSRSARSSTSAGPSSGRRVAIASIGGLHPRVALRKQQLLLAGEVAEERARADVGRGGDVGDGRLARSRCARTARSRRRQAPGGCGPACGRAETRQSALRSRVRFALIANLHSSAVMVGGMTTTRADLRRRRRRPDPRLLAGPARVPATVVERSPGLRSSGNPVDVRGPALPVAERDGHHARAARGRHPGDRDERGRRLGTAGRAGPDAGDAGGRGTEVELPRGDLAALLYEAARDDAEFLFDDTIVTLRQDEHGVDVTFDRAAAAPLRPGRRRRRAALHGAATGVRPGARARAAPGRLRRDHAARAARRPAAEVLMLQHARPAGLHPPGTRRRRWPPSSSAAASSPASTTATPRSTSRSSAGLRRRSAGGCPTCSSGSGQRRRPRTSTRSARSSAVVVARPDRAARRRGLVRLAVRRRFQPRHGRRAHARRGSRGRLRPRHGLPALRDPAPRPGPAQAAQRRPRRRRCWCRRPGPQSAYATWPPGCSRGGERPPARSAADAVADMDGLRAVHHPDDVQLVDGQAAPN